MLGTLYVIENIFNGKKYVGKTYKTLEQRFKEHINDSKRERNKNRDLYKAINFFGCDKFKIYEIGKFEQGVLEEKEIEYILKLDTYKNGYNQTLGGDGKRYIETSDVEFAELYYKLGTVSKVSEYTGHDAGYISKILKNSGVNIAQNGRKPIMIVQNGMKFESPTECARWLIDNGFVKTKVVKYASENIKRVIRGERKQYVGFTFSFIDND